MDFFGCNRARRGERDGSIVCHKCGDNKEGYCKKYSKWCSAVRHLCEPKFEPVNEVSTEPKDKRRAWHTLYSNRSVAEIIGVGGGDARDNTGHIQTGQNEIRLSSLY